MDEHGFPLSGCVLKMGYSYTRNSQFESRESDHELFLDLRCTLFLGRAIHLVRPGAVLAVKLVLAFPRLVNNGFRHGLKMAQARVILLLKFI